MYVDYSGWGSEYNTDTHIVMQLKKIKSLWEQEIIYNPDENTLLVSNKVLMLSCLTLLNTERL